jgi:hypothetical protein
LTGLGTVSTSSQALVTFEAAIDDYSTQYGFRLYQVPGFGTNPLAFLIPQSWTPVDLSSGCVANAQFNNNSCTLFQDGSGKTQILIRPQAAGYVSGTGYVLVVSRGMTSPTGRVLKYTYMIPFVTQ